MNSFKSFVFGEHLRRLFKNGAPGEAHANVIKGFNLEIQERDVLGLLTGAEWGGKIYFDRDLVGAFAAQERTAIGSWPLHGQIGRPGQAYSELLFIRR